MTISLTLACIWLVVANILAVLPSRDNHWRRAYILISVGIPLLMFVIYENGIWLGILLLLAGMSMLRWPVMYLWRWIKAQAGKRG